MESMTLKELGTLYKNTLATIENISQSITQAWEDGDKRQAKNLELAGDEYIDTLCDVEEVLAGAGLALHADYCGY